MTTVSATPRSDERSRGRPLFWLGLLGFVLALLLPMLQFFVLRRTSVPWYSPAIATAAALLLLASVVRRAGVLCIAALVLVAAFAGFAWYFLAVMVRLPEYRGPAQEGERLPAFTATRADGKSFTDADLRDGSRRVMVFFRGRW